MQVTIYFSIFFYLSDIIDQFDRSQGSGLSYIAKMSQDLSIITSRSPNNMNKPVADAGFPVGGCAPIRGHGPPMWVLFSENVCENERIGSHRGWHAPGTSPHRSANASLCMIPIFT